VHRVCALDLTVEVCLLAVDKKVIVFFPCLNMLLQVQQIVLLDEQCFEDMNVVGWFALATCQPDISVVVHVDRQHTPVTTGVLPFFSSLTISRPNSNACLHWNDIVQLVDINMVIARANLPLV
jgi:hypothetical protein